MLDKTRQQVKRVREYMISYIIDNRLRVGERCAAEFFFANELKVNRRTVRMTIDILCSEGILEKRASRGIYVKSLPVPEGESNGGGGSSSSNSSGGDWGYECFFPMGSLFGDSGELVNFGLDDPESAGWDRIFEEFRRSVGGKYRICPQYRIPFKDRETPIPECDLYMVSPRDIGFRRMELKSHPRFSADWFRRHPFINSIRPELAAGIRDRFSYGRPGVVAVPVGFVFPFQLINRELCAAMRLKPLPMTPSFGEMSSWLEEVFSLPNHPSLFPFIQNPLHHICRLNRDVLPAGTTDRIVLDLPELREFFVLQKRFFRHFMIDRPRIITPAMIEIFRGRNFLLIEFFTNITMHVNLPAHNADDTLCSCCNCMDARKGGGQLMFRFLVMNSAPRNREGAERFADFLCGPVGQRLLAREKLMFPCCHDDENADLLCAGTPLDREMLRYEMAHAEGFFQHGFFMTEFDEVVFTPLMQSYFNDLISLDDAIRRIERSDFAASTAAGYPEFNL